MCLVTHCMHYSTRQTNICRSIGGCFYRLNFDSKGQKIKSSYKQLLYEVFVISRIIEVERGKRLRLITLPRPWLFWISRKPNLIIVLLYIEQKQLKSFFCFSLTASNTKRENLTWLPLEIMHSAFFLNYCLSDMTSTTKNKKNGALRSQAIFGFFISVPDHFRLGWRAVSSRMSREKNILLVVSPLINLMKTKSVF